MPPMRQRSMVDLRLSEEFRRRHNNNNNNNMNKRPFTDDFPVHIRNQVNSGILGDRTINDKSMCDKITPFIEKF